jgi:hypothetical protein
MALIDTIAQFLCREHVSECMSSVQQQSPDLLVQLTFLAFFPTVFLILLIYFMSEAIIGTGHKGLRTLLGIAVYLFIVFYGWYHFALAISKFWFIALIILGGIGIFVHRMSGGGAGGAGRGAGLSSGRFPGGGVFKYGIKRVSKLGSKPGLEKGVKQGIEELKGLANDIEHPRGRGTDVGTLRREFHAIKAGILRDITTLESEYGYLVEKAVVDKYKDAIDELDKKVAKAGGKEEKEYRKAA